MSHLVFITEKNYPELLENSSEVSKTSLHFPELLENSSSQKSSQKSHHEPPGVNNGYNCPQISNQTNQSTNQPSIQMP